jgi:hypothetical protein
VRLLPLLATGDLNDDGMDDAAAIADVSGAARNGLYLLVFTSQSDSTLEQSSAVLIGSGQIASGLAITEAQILVELDQMASPESTCCATAAEQRTYTLRNGRLMLVDAQPLELPDLPRTGTASPAETFPMDAGESIGTVEGELEAGAVTSYLLEGGEALTATITLDAESGAAALAISRQGMPAALLAARSGNVTWTGALPATGALVLDVVSLTPEGAPIPYTLTTSLEEGSLEEGLLEEGATE